MDTFVHRWKFFRAGGVDQVSFRNGNDIANLETLDQKLWLALACPAHGLEFDTRTLEFIDTDKDGRIRAPELLAAIKWLKEVLCNLDDLFKGGNALPLASINEQTVAGAALLSGAKRILADAGQPGKPDVTVADVLDSEQRFAQTRFNGDGVVPADSAGEPETRQVIEDILRTHGAVPDRSGKPGVNQARVDAFFAEARQYALWLGKAENDKALCPLGESTQAVAAAVMAVKTKVDDYFARCRLAAFDSHAAQFLNGAEPEYKALATKELRYDTEEMAHLPLAHIAAGRALPLTDGVNPAWAAALTTLQGALGPLLGGQPTVLTESDWSSVQSQLAAYQAFTAAKPTTAVATLGPERVRAILGSRAEESLADLIKQDAAMAPEFNQLAAVQKLVLLQRDFVNLLNNFVNFTTFYSRQGAVFQVGTLYLDGRSCDLCVRVEDAARHAALAGLSRNYLAYCDCVRPGGEKLAIAAAFTGGDTDNLMVGRNGLFYDRAGRDWDATITKVIENPISIRQAFWAPYKNFVRLIEQQVAKRAAADDVEASNKLVETASASAPADQPKPGEAHPESPKKIDVGTVAAIGVGVAGLATFLSSILAVFFGLGAFMPLGFAVLLLAISGPSMLIAWLKLRQRNLGPILDANGWAINGRVKINVPFGGALTSVAALPRGAERTVRDPYAEKKRPWRLYLALLIALALAALWYLGKLDRFLPESGKSTEVLGRYAPARP